LLVGGFTVAAFIVDRSLRRPPHPKHDQPTSISQVTIVSADANSSEPESTDVPTASTAGDIVFIDPGHGGVDNGATGTTIDGETVYEKTIALALAQRTATKLRAAGYKVVLSRTTDALPGLLASDLTPDGQSLTDQGVLNDLQRRIDRANASGAKFLLSIHLNANDDPSVSGTTTYYDSTRTFAAANLQFAQLVQTDLISGLRAKGYTTPDLGVLDDTDLDGNDLGVLPGTYNHLVLLGPASPGQLRPSLMPGALNESLFLSNVSEATAATQAAMQDLLASGYARAISHSFSR
jgi:N-acetylmuramoyl-L-alanine amidase